MTRTQRLLIATIATGALLIAGIGFTGSYTAIRDLAADKDFGAFAYLFPIGIDAGICVLLALDLLLTHHRIPLPLLRHTAWLLTTATIAFNAATAWPDPLATGMHAVTPLLFITTIEAARHATGRIAALTAHTHMDPIRPARWLLAPVPTFLLWRRMKLWEQRSYTQALELEQQRLLYQAQLRTRYGRAWRHRAPTTELIPLRLTRYGIPLSHTTPHTRPSAASTDQKPDARPTPGPPNTPDNTPQPPHSETITTQPANPEPTPSPSPAPNHASNPTHPSSDPKAPTLARHAQQLQAIYRALNALSRSAPIPTHWAWWHRHRSHTAEASSRDASDLPATHPEPLDMSHAARTTGSATQQQINHSHSAAPRHQHRAPTPPDTTARTPPRHEGDTGHDTSPAPNDHPATARTLRDATASSSTHRLPAPPLQPASHPAPRTQQRTATHDNPRPTRPTPLGPVDGPLSTAPQEQHHPHPDGASRQPSINGRLTQTDRYYLAWMNYQAEHGTEPTPEQLSTHLARKGLLGRGGKPLSPSNLRRHFLNWRIYNLWTTHRTHNAAPPAADIAHHCATHQLTGQYNRPITPAYITRQTPEFERRWHTLTHQPPQST